MNLLVIRSKYLEYGICIYLYKCDFNILNHHNVALCDNVQHCLSFVQLFIDIWSVKYYYYRLYKRGFL